MSKIMTAEAAVKLIKDGDCIATTSAGMVGYPEYISGKVEESFLATGHPKDLTLYQGCGHGIPPKPEVGDAHFAHEGMLKKIIASHPDVIPRIIKLVVEEKIEAYALPQGILNQLYRAAAAKQPGLLSRIGLGTYIDPRQDGGKLNARTTEDIVSVMTIDSAEYLFFKSFPVTCAIIRATTADEAGNLSIEKEGLKLEILEAALAAKASGGTVIAQVERVVKKNSIPAKNVVVPGQIVDAVVIAENPDVTHMQTAGTIYSPYISGELKGIPDETLNEEAALAANNVICRRAAFELYPGAIVNIGKGIGDGVGTVAAQEGVTEQLTFTVELGAIGGMPMKEADFGVCKNPTAYLAHPAMFDFYHAGMLDITFLGAAQIDKDGNVNVSKYGGHPAGQGGFIDITQTSKKVVFCTCFKAKGLKAIVENGQLKIEKEGAISKFVDQVEQITLNGKLTRQQGREVVIVTERCVFRLEQEGLVLTEIAPGVDLQKDILDQMEFQPIISNELKTMDERIFRPGKLDLFKTNDGSGRA